MSVKAINQALKQHLLENPRIADTFLNGGVEISTYKKYSLTSIWKSNL